MGKILEDFIDSKVEEIEKIVTEYPNQVPVPVVAKFMAMAETNLREAIDSNQALGLSWIKKGKSNHGYAIPTIKFVSFVLHLNLLERV